MRARLSTLGIAFVVTVAAPAAVAQTVTVSVSSDGTPGNADSSLPDMSATGRFTAFASIAANLVPGDTNGVEDVFLRDRDTDADGVFDEPGAVSTVRVSQRGAAEGRARSTGPAISGRPLRRLHVLFVDPVRDRPAAAVRVGGAPLGSAHGRHRPGQPGDRR